MICLLYCILDYTGSQNNTLDNDLPRDLISTNLHASQDVAVYHIVLHLLTTFE